jgi:hypothetical protein
MNYKGYFIVSTMWRYLRWLHMYLHPRMRTAYSLFEVEYFWTSCFSLQSKIVNCSRGTLIHYLHIFACRILQNTKPSKKFQWQHLKHAGKEHFWLAVCTWGSNCSDMGWCLAVLEKLALIETAGYSACTNCDSNPGKPILNLPLVIHIIANNLHRRKNLFTTSLLHKWHPRH